MAACQRYPSAIVRPSSARRARSSGRSSRSRKAARQRVFVLGVEVPARLAADLGQGGRVGERHRDPLRHRLDGGDAEALAERREDQRLRLGIRRAEGLALAIARHPDERPGADLGDRRAQGADLGLVPRAEEDQAELAGGHFGEPRRRADQADQVLPRLEVGHREEIREAVGEPEVGPHPRPFALRRRLEEQVLRAVGDVRHPPPAVGEGLQEPLGIEPRDRRDQVGAPNVRASRRSRLGPP